MAGPTYSLKSTPNDRFFEKLFMGILFILRVFARNLLKGNRRRNNFRISFWCLTWDSNPGFDLLSTHYLLDHGDFSTGIRMFNICVLSLSNQKKYNLSRLVSNFLNAPYKRVTFSLQKRKHLKLKVKACNQSVFKQVWEYVISFEDVSLEKSFEISLYTTLVVTWI